MPAAETSSRKMSSLHLLVKVLHNYTVTNPQDICGREHGCHTCSSHALACQMRALKNWCWRQLLNMRSIRNRGTHGIIQPLPWLATPFHTWLLHCFQRRLKLSSARTSTNPPAQAQAQAPPAGQTSTHLGEVPASSHSVGCRDKCWRWQGYSSSQLLLLTITELKLSRFLF